MWLYRAIPDALRLPACERCHNRGKVTMILRCVFHCGDCGHVFAAVWTADEAALPDARQAAIGEQRSAG